MSRHKGVAPLKPRRALSTTTGIVILCVAFLIVWYYRPLCTPLNRSVHLVQQPAFEGKDQGGTVNCNPLAVERALVDEHGGDPGIGYLSRFMELHQPQNAALESNKWKPMILNECTDLMPDWYAPCLNRTAKAIVYGEEIVYPDFEAKIPGFVNEEDKKLWTAKYSNEVIGQTKDNKRAWHDKAQDYIIHVGARGQNLIISNISFQHQIPDMTWEPASDHCLGHMNRHVPLSNSPAAQGRAKNMDEVLLMITPDAPRFQHFLDHAVKLLVQSAHLIRSTTRVLAHGGQQPSTNEMWHWFPFLNYSQVDFELLSGGVPVNAGRLIDSCRTPYVHPWLFFRYQEMVLGPQAPLVPLAQRNKVLYFSRNHPDSNRANAGRTISNEDALLDAIRALLEKRGQGEELVMMEPGKFGSLAQTAQWINANARAMLGPHGGGLCNVKFAAKHTLVMEFQPSDWVNVHFYEECVAHALNYYVIFPKTFGTHDMTVNISDIMEVLVRDLGKTPEKPILRWHYDWPNALEAKKGDENFPEIKCCP